MLPKYKTTSSKKFHCLSELTGCKRNFCGKNKTTSTQGPDKVPFFWEQMLPSTVGATWGRTKPAGEPGVPNEAWDALRGSSGPTYASSDDKHKESLEHSTLNLDFLVVHRLEIS